MIKHIVSTKDMDLDELEGYFAHADLMSNPYKHVDQYYMLRGKVVGLWFDESSTRTRVSFEAAVKKMGGEVIHLSSKDMSSVKGESLQDSIKCLSQYLDLIVFRSSSPNDIYDFVASKPTIPVINAGNGDLEHPTQAILDLYTIKREIGRLHNIKVMFIGDLKYSRTIHSLLNLLDLYKNVTVYNYSPQSLPVPEEYRSLKLNIVDLNKDNLDSMLREVDVVYITRTQKERLLPDELLGLNDTFCFDKMMLNCLKEDAIVMHPLPRTSEIDKDIDADDRVAYFRQVKNGLYIRMGILYSLLKK